MANNLKTPRIKCIHCGMSTDFKNWSVKLLKCSVEGNQSLG